LGYKSYYRHASKGSWTLSTADNGCSISDCTAEALKVRKNASYISNLLKNLSVFFPNQNIIDML
jgi:squalene cyclase